MLRLTDADQEGLMSWSRPSSELTPSKTGDGTAVTGFMLKMALDSGGRCQTMSKHGCTLKLYTKMG